MCSSNRQPRTAEERWRLTCLLLDLVRIGKLALDESDHLRLVGFIAQLEVRLSADSWRAGRLLNVGFPHQNLLAGIGSLVRVVDGEAVRPDPVGRAPIVARSKSRAVMIEGRSCQRTIR